MIVFFDIVFPLLSTSSVLPFLDFPNAQTADKKFKNIAACVLEAPAVY